MSKVYVVWGYTDASDDFETTQDVVLGVFNGWHQANHRMRLRTGKETWASQAITAYKLNECQDVPGPEIGEFIARVELEDLPIEAEEEDS